TDDLKLQRQIKHNIEIVIDRLKVEQKVRPRLAEAVEQALALGEGSVIIAGEAPPPPGPSPTRGAGGRTTPPAPPVGGGGGGGDGWGGFRRHRARGALRLHLLRPELRAAQPAAVQLQQPAGHVPRL